ncbi:MAG: hypothetical protein E7232_06585 [Lachnospiraceae bacterium]|jgi:hypothetical protein|nr:hypothetical protein [Lachnospiraceae bacterium]
MSVNIRFSLNDSAVNDVISRLKNISGKSEESVFKKAVNETAKYARRELSKKAKRVYASPQSDGIYERAIIKKATVGDLGAEVDFGNQARVPSILKFRAEPESTPTVFTSQDVRVRRIGNGYRYLGKQKSYNVRSSQWRSGGMTAYRGAFIATMGSGRTGMFIRTGQKTASGKDKLRQILGSTDRAMVRNEKVYPEVAPKISERLNEQVQKALAKALGGR